MQVNKIRDQCQKQEDTIREQEGELDTKRDELQKLQNEESALEKEYDTNKVELQRLSKSLQDTQLQISQIKAMVTQLQESQRQMSDALSLCKSAMSTNDPSMVSEYSLKLQPDFRVANETLKEKQVNYAHFLNLNNIIRFLNRKANHLMMQVDLARRPQTHSIPIDSRLATMLSVMVAAAAALN